ncbi:hypothetical protein DSM112329_03771 [Paraconexibacter sp. AEG42_29]|uniref:Uncharacterized protein n=1 Tax=Paraconexibacter sp. AEG42_29 TaxID=2997339 RepID=A0AAU7AYV4_9ACTN
MTLVTILGIVVVVGIPVLILLTRLTPKIDERTEVAVEQEAQGVGADQKEDPDGARGPSMLG